MDALLQALGFDWKILLANLVNFFILLFILSKIGLKPMRAFIEKRQKEIADGIENAKKAAESLEHAEEDVKNIITAAHKEAQGIIGSAREQAEKQAQELIAKQQEEIAQATHRAKADIAAERDRVLQETKEQAVSLIIAATEKLLRKKVDTEADQAHVEKILAEMKS